MTNSENVAKKLGLEHSDQGLALTRASLLQSVGGKLGIAEAILPAFGFSLVFTFTKSALWSVSLAAALSLAFILTRLVQRRSPSQALVGMLAVGLAAFLALRDGGQAVDYFIPGFITNAAYGAVLLVSILIRMPILGFAGQFLFGLTTWRSDKLLVKRFSFITLIWVSFFALRLAVQIPLFLANAVEALAIARMLMGAPAYAGLLALTWVLMRSLSPNKPID